MAMTKCKECGKEISTKAGACPNCGAKVKKQVGILGIIFSLIVGGAIFSGVTASKKEEIAQANKSPQQIAAEKAKKDADLHRYAVAVAAAKSIKGAMRDPDSLKFDSMRVSEDGKTVCAEYRAKNGFGGMNKEFVTFVKDIGHRDAATWNKNCRGAMTDQLYAVE